MPNSNTRSDATISVTYSNKAPGDRIDDPTIFELERRVIATITEGVAVGDAVVSSTPPDDKTKIWYIADDNGVPTGEQYTWNELTNQWESTTPVTEDPICLSENAEQVITLDANGCWLVSYNDIILIAGEGSPSISGDADNILVQGTDAGWYVGPHAVPLFISTDSGNAITFGGDGGLYVPVATTPTQQNVTVTIQTTPYLATIESTTILVDDDTIGGDVVITLPSTAIATNGTRFTVKKLGSTGSVTTNPTGTQTIDGATTSAPLTVQYESITFVSDGANYLII